MSYNENFVVRNGLEVASGLIYADYLTNKVGIGTTTLTDTLTVSGNISGQNVYISGISTVSQKLNVGLAGTVLTASATSGFVGIGTTNPQYALDVRVGSGQTAFYTNGDLIVDGNFETSSVTVSDASISNINVSGILTASSTNLTSLNVSGSSILGVTSATSLNVSGITTVGFITATNLNVSGITTVGFITATDSYISGTSTITTAVITNLNATNISVGGIITSTVSDLTATGITSTNNLNVSGVSTFNGNVYVNGPNLFVGDTSSDEIVVNSTFSSDLFPTLTKEYNLGNSSKMWKSVNAGLGTFDNLYTSGISTLGTVKISSGIITATTGIVTYYGDGSNLTGLPQQGIGIQSAGTVIGSGITSLNFIGVGNTFSINGNSVDISISGIGTQWITTSSGIVTTSNVGIGTTNPTSRLTVSGDVNITGVVTASSFVGNVTGNATGLTGTPNISVGNIIGSAATFTNLTVNGTQTIINTTELNIADKTVGIASTSTPSDALSDGAGIVVYGDTNKTLLYDNTRKGWDFNIPLTTDEIRFYNVAEKLIRSDGNTVSLTYSSSGSNIGFATNPTGDITLAVTGIPTSSDFDNHVMTFSVFVNQTGTARSCTAVTLNGVSRTIKWSGGSLGAAILGVTTSNGYDIYSFTGINTVGSASTTANYQVLGVVNGGFR